MFSSLSDHSWCFSWVRKRFTAPHVRHVTTTCFWRRAKRENKNTVWLVIFVSTNFCKIIQNSDFRNFRGFNFHDRWIWDPQRLLPLSALRRCLDVHLCLRSILDNFSDSCQRHPRWHTFVGCCTEVGQGLKHSLLALHVGNKIFTVLIFANGSWLATNAKISTSRKLPTIQYHFENR